MYLTVFVIFVLNGIRKSCAVKGSRRCQGTKMCIYEMSLLIAEGQERLPNTQTCLMGNET